MSIQHNPHNVGRLFLIVGCLMLLIAAITGGYLYNSFGHSLFERFIYACIGVLFAALGALLLPAAAILWKTSPLLAFLVFMLWVSALFPIGTQTHLGFMALSQSHVESVKTSQSFASEYATQEIAAANAKVEKYQQFASIDVAASERKKYELELELISLQARLKSCPVNYIKNCITPTTQEIDATKPQIEALQQEIAGARSYDAALQAKKEAYNDKREALHGGDNSTIHPLFATQSTLLGNDAKTLQAYFLGFSAVIFEMFTALSFIIAFSILPQNANASAGYTDFKVIKTENALKTETALPIKTETALPIKTETSLPIKTETALKTETSLPIKTETALHKKCAFCGVDFIAKSPNQKFCCTEHRNLFHGKTIGY